MSAVRRLGVACAVAAFALDQGSKAIVVASPRGLLMTDIAMIEAAHNRLAGRVLAVRDDQRAGAVPASGGADPR